MAAVYGAPRKSRHGPKSLDRNLTLEAAEEGPSGLKRLMGWSFAAAIAHSRPIMSATLTLGY
ncbi:hypothetical protein ACRE_060570 [Hapsidospora chrysogenum ATCC 11550]|uniref:Uncharacterized protein n=1 Tax=Hapsidospora chrysogenum (strain ATCC 11550 / CBS 779.69 / DSM 880 / IAM 14645 / JCM 23072 / IMI 49137) TaxID=857340 RepID=A0A086T1G0_HAPC1|nr:hypothetical protein ACRE_060570 [Hapsidospora chrysogenum ATCC 11550]